MKRYTHLQWDFDARTKSVMSYYTCTHIVTCEGISLFLCMLWTRGIHSVIVRIFLLRYAISGDSIAREW